MYPGLALVFLPPANEICGKGLFSRVFCCLQGGLCKGGSLSRGTSVRLSLSRGSLSGGQCPGCISVQMGCLCRGRSLGVLCLGGICQGDTPGQRTPVRWRVGSMHPTGMLSCWFLHCGHFENSVTLIVEVIDGVILKFLRLNEETHKSHFQKVLKRFILQCCFNFFLTITTFWLHARNYRHWWSQSFEFPTKKRIKIPYKSNKTHFKGPARNC